VRRFKLVAPKYARAVAVACAFLVLIASGERLISSSARAAEPVVHLRVGAMPIDAAGEVFYAEEMGFFKTAGLDVDISVFGTGSPIVAGVVSGSLDIGYASSNNVILARDRGVLIRYLAPATLYTPDLPSAAALIVAKDSPIRSATDLTGKTIAVAGLRDLTSLAIAAWIDKNGGDSKSVQYIEMPFAQMLPSLVQGRVAAAAVVEPFKTASENNSRVLAELNGAIADRYLLSGYFASDEWLQRNQDAARRFVSVMQNTAKWANAHRNETAAMLGRYSKIRPESIATMGRSHYDDILGVSAKDVAPVIDLMARYSRLNAVTPSAVVWELRSPVKEGSTR
jgi:NitT/TauT family transport system substrate-binding protein